jgi:membrane-associated phospholipid phosphatase
MLPYPLRHGLIVLLVSSILVVISYVNVDKPLVYWAYHQHVREVNGLNYLTYLPNMFNAFALLAYPILLLRFFYGRFTVSNSNCLYIANSIAIAHFLKSLLKALFGRTWPVTWKCNNLSLIQDQVYTLHWFQGGVINDAFPSGHMATSVAAMAAVAIAYPKLRIMAGLICSLVAIGLIALYYHYCSDVIAGALLGYLTAYYAAYLSKVRLLNYQKVSPGST